MGILGWFFDDAYEEKRARAFLDLKQVNDELDECAVAASLIGSNASDERKMAAIRRMREIRARRGR